MPAGDLEKAKISYQFGADACYGSTSAFSMRTREIGFTFATLKKAIEYAHSIDKKFYVPINIFPHENEMKAVKKHVEKIISIRPDAIIVADLGVLSLANKLISRSASGGSQKAKKLEIHLSTQVNAINSESIKQYAKFNIKRVILPREISIDNIKRIRKNLPKSIELEAFVHGAMCMSISGRCHLSNYLTGRDANHGQCVQTCRWNFSVKEEKRPNEYFDIEEDKRYSYIFNAKDLCMIEHLDKLQKAGVISFKIEGRNKSIYYCGVVARAYRNAIDTMCHPVLDMGSKNSNNLSVDSRLCGNNNIDKIIAQSKRELNKVTSRGYSTGFFFKKPSQNDTEYKTSRPTSNWQFVGIVKDEMKLPHKSFTQKGYRKYIVEGRNEIKKNSNVEIVTPNKIYKKKLTNFIKPNGDKLEKINPGYEFVLESNNELPVNSMLRTTK